MPKPVIIEPENVIEENKGGDDDGDGDGLEDDGEDEEDG